MDQDILKLLPKKAFKLLSVKETLRIGTIVTKSIFDKEAYEKSFQSRVAQWRFADIRLSREIPLSKEAPLTKSDGEKVLKIYFSQFFEKELPTHIDLRKHAFGRDEIFAWTPSKLFYHFSKDFLEGICSLYVGFYNDDGEKFEAGLFKLKMINESMDSKHRSEIRDLFYKHFGEGRVAPVSFSLDRLQESFNAIFSYFLRNDIPLNPEFAVLGICLVTLYLTLQEIPESMEVNRVFLEVASHYQL